MYESGRVGCDYIVGMDRECTRIDEAVSDPISSEAYLALGWRDWSVILGNLSLNLLTIVTGAVNSFRKM